MRPLVSVVMPSLNQGRFLGAALDSTLEQSWRPLEILVLDGGSSDETPAVLDRYRARPEVRVWSEPDAGVVDAVNRGLARAQGTIAAIQSSDDLYRPGAIETAVRAFEADPELGLAFADVDLVDEDGRRTGTDRLPTFSLEGLLTRALYVPQPSAFFRLDLARELGGWDDRFPYVPDLDLWIRLAFRCRVLKLPGVLAATRDHGERRDKQNERIHRDYARMLECSRDLAAAPRRLRRAARAGQLLLGVRYPTETSRRRSTLDLWAAALLYPRCLRQPGFPRHRLVPGYFRLAGMVGRARRWLARQAPGS